MIKNILLIFIFFLAACKQEKEVKIINVDSEVKEEVVVEKKVNAEKLPDGTNLIMGIVIPTANNQWFIKVAGPSSEFTAVTKLIDKIVATIKFDDYSVEVVTYELTEGWQVQKEKGYIHSVLTHKDFKTTVSILKSKIIDFNSKRKQTFLEVINDWNRQLGNHPVQERMLPQLCFKKNINGNLGFVFVLTPGSTQPQQPTRAKLEAMRVAFATTAGSTWYLKISGDSKTIDAEKDNFEKFVTSFKIEGGEGKWDAPSTWTAGSSGGMIKASYEVGGAKVTVIPLGAQSGGLADNVNRWRGQVGLAAQSEEDIKKDMKILKAGDVEFMYFHLSSGAATATPDKEPPSEEPKSEGVAYKLPEGWDALAPSSMRRVNLLAGDAAVTAIFLPPIAKGLKKNVDRWCGQIGMPVMTDAELAKLTQKVSFSGGSADYVSLIGKEKSILAVVYDLEDGVWFFKAFGSTESINANKKKFEEFISSVKLEEAK